MAQQRATGNVGITIDVMEAAPDSDVIVLVSGDGDFDLLAKKVREKYACRVEVYGVEALTASSLMLAATEFNPIRSELLL